MASVSHFTLNSLLLVGDAVFHGPYFYAEIKTLQKKFYIFLWATSFSEDTCLWMRVDARPINFVSREVTGVSSVLCLARRMAKSILPVTLVCHLGPTI